MISPSKPWCFHNGSNSIKIEKQVLQESEFITLKQMMDSMEVYIAIILQNQEDQFNMIKQLLQTNITNLPLYVDNKKGENTAKNAEKE